MGSDLNLQEKTNPGEKGFSLIRILNDEIFRGDCLETVWR
jgi:hypothetical protein